MAGRAETETLERFDFCRQPSDSVTLRTGNVVCDVGASTFVGGFGMNDERGTLAHVPSMMRRASAQVTRLAIEPIAGTSLRVGDRHNLQGRWIDPEEHNVRKAAEWVLAVRPIPPPSRTRFGTLKD